MNKRQQEVEAIFNQARDIPTGSGRDAYVAEACGTDADLRDRIETLLRADEQAGTFLLKPVVDANAPGDRSTEAPGARIGRYKLLQRIGEGGFGSVYTAEQDEPVRRLVALKIIKLGMDTRQVIARFEAERQALAMMDHPHIAKVLDGGATDSGRPYFVMDLVKGIPITEYCDHNNLALAQRLELFIAVCSAVQHAHQKGIIHRDIKPGNVLVTLHDGKAAPKVIDFGIAKAINHRLTENTVFTELEQLIGTPAYMSPEQAEMSGLDVDTRTDIYSLGVLLYELLTGTTPHDPRTLRRAAYDEIRRIIRDVDPPKPSTRLSNMLSGSGGRNGPSRSEERSIASKRSAPTDPFETFDFSEQAGSSTPGPSVHDIARRRRTAPSVLSKLLQGDMDWIVMKCLDKDRTRRYETANELGADVGRYLRGEPVVAAPPGAAYRLRKLVKRNKGAFLGGSIVAAALIVGLSAATWGFVSASRERDIASQERDIASRERDKAERIADFMSRMLSGVAPAVAMGRDTTMLREMLDDAAERMRNGELEGAPEVEIRLRTSLAHTYGLIAAYGAAKEMALPLLNLVRTAYGEENEHVAHALRTVARTLSADGQPDEALPKFETAVKMYRRAFQGDHPELAAGLNDLGDCLQHFGRPDEALPDCQAALEMSQRLFKGDHPDVAENLDRLAGCLSRLDRSDEALTRLEAALEMRRRLFDGDHPEVARSLNNVAGCLQGLRHFDAALTNFEAALKMRQRLFKGDHPDVARSLTNVAESLSALGRQEEALSKCEAALEMRQRLFKGDHPDVATSLHSVAYCLRACGRSEEALPKFEAALEMRLRLFKGAHPDVAKNLTNIGFCLKALDRMSDALPKFEAALDMNQRFYKGDHPEVASSLYNAARCLEALGRSREALSKHEEALEMRRRLFKGVHPDVVRSLRGAIACLLELGATDQALDKYTDLVEMLRRPADPEDPQLDTALGEFGFLLLQQGKHDQAEAPLRECLAIRERALADGHPQVWRRFDAMSMLGGAVAGQAAALIATDPAAAAVQFGEAESLLVDAYNGMKDDPTLPTPVQAGADHARRAIERIVRLYEIWEKANPGQGYSERAAHWLAKLDQPSD